MKNIIVNILNQCIFNKSINNFNAITKFIHLIQDKGTTYASIDIVDYDSNDSAIHVHFRDKDYKLLTVSFNSSEYIVINLDCNCTNTMINCDSNLKLRSEPKGSYNMQYNDIRNILQAI